MNTGEKPAKALADRIAKLLSRRDKLRAQRLAALAELAESKQQPDIDLAVKAARKSQATIAAADADLDVVESFMDDESAGLDQAITELERAVQQQDQQHAKAMRAAMDELLQSPDGMRAKQFLAAAQELLHHINPMLDFETHDTLKQILRSSTAERVDAFQQLVNMPEEQPEPPELAILKDARKQMEAGTTPWTAADAANSPRGFTQTNVNATASQDDIEAMRDEMKRRNAAGRIG